MAQALQAAIRDATATSTNRVGMCLQQVQTWYRIPAAQPDASAAWRATRLATSRRPPPRGAPVFWTGGRQSHGHIAMVLGGA